MPAFQVSLPPRHPGQLMATENLARFNTLACGRRFGKTALMLDLGISGNEPRNPDAQVVRGLLQGGKVGWFAPSVKYLEEVWQRANELLQGPLLLRRDVQQKRLLLVNGASFDFWTLHNTPDAGRGRAYDLVLVDEAAMVGHLGLSWSRSIRPTLTDFAGVAVIGSTPAGENFFKELFDRGHDGPGSRPTANWRSWQLPTSTNPFIPPEEIELARQELDDLSYRTEYLAEFISEFGALYGEPTPYQPADFPQAGKDGTGCDFAYSSSSRDWTVFVQGRASLGKIYIYHMYREQGTIDQWAPELRDMPNPFAFVGGQEKLVLQAISQKYGSFVSSRPAAAKKKVRAQPSIAAWNRGDILVPDSDEEWIRTLVRELRSFTGEPGMDANDDIVDALAALHHVTLAQQSFYRPRRSQNWSYAD